MAFLIVATRSVSTGTCPALSAVVGEGFSVRQAGEAMDAGAIGDWIRVRGLKNGQAQGEAMRARITRPGEVVVELRD